MARRGDGLYLRKRTWWLDFVHEGKRHAVRIGKNISRTVAGEIAVTKRGQILKGEVGIGRKRKDLPFEKATEIFLEWMKANRRPKTYQSYSECVERLGESFNRKKLGEITPFLVEKHKKKRVDAGRRVSANRELSCLHAIFNRCRDWGKYEGDNPVEKVKLLKEPKGRARYLTPAEETRLLEQARELRLRAIILAGIHAGLRIASEALTLRRQSVNMERGPWGRWGFLSVEAAYAKSGKTRAVPLNSTLHNAFAEYFEKVETDGDFVFANKKGQPFRSVRSAFRTACKNAGLKGVTPHTLRHTFTSRLVMAGVDLRTVQELGGWASLKMVERYSHLSPSHKADAIERIASKNSTTLFTTPGERESEAEPATA